MDNNIFSLVISPPFPNIILFIKVLFLGISSILLTFIIFLLFFKTRWLRFRFLEDIFEFFTYRPYGVKKLIKHWAKIKGRLETGLESEYKLAVIEADSALDEILKKMGYAGETMGERLEKINAAVLPIIEEIRGTHKIRNNIVHDPDYRLNLDEARKAISIYEKTLTDLGAL